MNVTSNVFLSLSCTHLRRQLKTQTILSHPCSRVRAVPRGAHTKTRTDLVSRTAVRAQPIDPSMKNDISRQSELDNPPLGNLAQGLHILMPQIAAAWAEKYRPPIINAPVGPPKEREPGGLGALPTPIQLGDSSSQPITERPLEHKPSP